MRWRDADYLASLAATGTDTWRLGWSEEWYVERFGCALIISFATEDLPSDALAAVLPRRGEGITAIYARRLVKGPDRDDVPVLIWGEAPANHQTIVRENNLRYEVDFQVGYSCGLFLDQRRNRAALAEWKPARVLNTFSYTCSFSVVAASVGAETLSLDLARQALDRGKRNFEINGLSTTGHRFIADDVLDVLPRLARRGEKFDAIILDPPTFSRGRNGRRFQAEKDYHTLLSHALACAAPRARLLLSTNCSSLRAGNLEEIGARLDPAATFHREPALPDIPTGEAASTVWMRLR